MQALGETLSFRHLRRRMRRRRREVWVPGKEEPTHHSHIKCVWVSTHSACFGARHKKPPRRVLSKELGCYQKNHRTKQRGEKTMVDLTWTANK